MTDLPEHVRATEPAGISGHMGAYQPILTRAADGINETGELGRPEEWRFGWERTYTREEWLDQVPTSGWPQPIFT